MSSYPVDALGSYEVGSKLKEISNGLNRLNFGRKYQLSADHETFTKSERVVATLNGSHMGEVAKGVADINFYNRGEFGSLCLGFKTRLNDGACCKSEPLVLHLCKGSRVSEILSQIERYFRENITSVEVPRQEQEVEKPGRSWSSVSWDYL
ncbi:MAG: hypothetical protein V3U72_02785 [Candidatus Aenigmarchaeota archaeon]